MKESIKNRITVSFMFIIMLAVILFEIVILIGINTFFYNREENALKTSLNYTIDYFNRYYSKMSINDILLEDLDVFWRNTEAQVQVLSLKGDLLSDSIGVLDSEKFSEKDIKHLLDGNEVTTIESPKYAGSKVLAVSKIIESDDGGRAILKFISSLKNVDLNIYGINAIVIFIGILIIGISAAIGLFLSTSITKPLEKITSSALKMADGQLKIKCDIENDDEIGKLAETLNYLSEELLKKEDIKNDFISSVSHELRTPLTSIKGWAVTLRLDNEQGSDLLKEGLDIIERESDRLTDMVEELLDFSRYVSGKITMNKSFCDVKNLIVRTVVEFMPRAEKYGITIIADISEDVGISMLDENRIKQVLINILENAIKFSKKDGIVKLNSDYNAGILEISIKDDGVGISEEDLPRVKEKFYKGKNVRSHSGIGLSISDEIVRLHSGNMDIISKEGRGTIVSIKIPCDEKIWKDY